MDGRSSIERSRAVAGVLAVGLGSEALYVLLTWWVPLLPTNLYTPLLDLGKITQYTPASATRFTLLVLGLFGLYACGYLLVRRLDAPLALVLACSLTSSLVLLWVYPATAVDVFGYIAQGRQLGLYHENPFLLAPAFSKSTAILPYLAYPGEPSQYGPAWAWIEAAIAVVAQGDGTLLREVLLYKLLAAGSLLALAALAYDIARRLGATHAEAAAGAYLLGCNPLLLWELAGNAHNDATMMLGGLGAVWLLCASRFRLALPALMLGALVKLPVIVLAPLLAIAVWKRDRRGAVEGVLLALVLAVVAYGPFWFGPATVTALSRGGLFTASFAASLWYLLRGTLGEADAATVARSVSLGLLAAAAVPIAWHALRKSRPIATATLGYASLLAFLLFGVTWFQAWYVVWPFALAAALPSTKRHVEVALFSFGAMLSYLVFIYVWVMGVISLEAPPNQYLAYAVIVSPLIAGWLIFTLMRWARAGMPELVSV